MGQMIGTARFDETGKYRYELRREWREHWPLKGPKGTITMPDKTVAFLMLNPSTADAAEPDPTVRRCIGYACAWGYGALEVVNLFAISDPDRSILRREADPIGPDNDRTILEVCKRADLVVAAWGADGALFNRGRQVRDMLAPHVQLRCLVTTADGEPGHPLYLSKALTPSPLP